MQFRIVLTAVIYQILFKRKLNLIQWASLIILTLGCLIKEYGLYSHISKIQHVHNATSELMTSSSPKGNYSEPSATSTTGNDTVNTMSKILWPTLMLLFQMFCSCFAGVYNEYLLKDTSTAGSADIILQNIFMYFDSIVCNMFVYVISGSESVPHDVKTSPNFMDTSQSSVSLSTALLNMLRSPLVLILIVNNALSGLVASFFLKSLNSILKTFASALELFAITILAWFLFGNSVDSHTAIALILVTISIYIYSKNPVSVAPPEKDSRSQSSPARDGFMLLPTSEE